MSRIIAVVAAAASVILCGCIKVSSSPPKDLPPYVRIMPGGQQMMTMNMGAMKAEVYQTSTAIPDVIAYYRTNAQVDGLAPQPTQTHANATTGEQQAAFADGGGRLLVVDAKPQDGKTLVTLAYRPVAKPS